jgi:phosphotransferase family enzyme
MDYRQHPTERWLEYFRATGHPEATPIGGGVEGATYRLRPGRVAKVWAGRTESELADLAAFYADLRVRELPFRTPLIEHIRGVDGSVVTEEVELPGHPLQEHLPDGEAIPEHAAEQLVAILAALRDIAWFDSARRLAVLAESAPLVSPGTSWPAATAALVARRFAAYRHLLARDVPEAERLVGRLCEVVGAYRIDGKGIVHGDLFGANVLVDGEQQVSAVLDFGFVTCAGDPDLDAAVVALIADQYGARAARSEALLDALLVARFGIDPRKLLVYKAVYAVVTCGYFSADGSDGHYPWCARILDRPEVREAVLSG